MPVRAQDPEEPKGGIGDAVREQAQAYVSRRRADASRTVSDVADAIRDIGSGLGGYPQIKAFFDEASLGVEEFAGGIARRSFREMVDEVEAAVRRRPGTAAAALAMAGFALYHLGRRSETGPLPRSRSLVPVGRAARPDA